MIELDLPPSPAPVPPKAESSGRPRKPRKPGDPIPFNWRRCANHPGSASESLCFSCGKAFCRDCSKVASHGFVCPECGEFGASSKEEAAAFQKAEIQRRPMWAELSKILTYPLGDPQSYLLLVLFMCVMGFAPLVGSLVAQCALLGYGFQALAQVASGDVGDFRPASINLDKFGEPFLLGATASLISFVPLLIATYYFLPSTFSAVMSKGAPSPEALLFLGLGLVWYLIYQPAALVVAERSRSWQATLNPLHGIRLMGQMGAVYWQALMIYLGLLAAERGVTLLIGSAHIPFLGTLASAFIASYAFICIGCALGFAVLKRAPDFG